MAVLEAGYSQAELMAFPPDPVKIVVPAPKPQGTTRTVDEARAAALSDPTRWRACVYEATGTPVTERDDTRVYLYCLKKTAEEKFRERISELQAAGYARDKRFRLGAGLVKLDHAADGSVWLAIDKR